MRWIKVHGYGVGFIGEITQVMRDLETKVRASRISLTGDVLVAARDPRGLLRGMAQKVVADVFALEFAHNEPAADVAHYLVTVTRQTDPATRITTLAATLQPVFDAAEVTRYHDGAIDHEDDRSSSEVMPTLPPSIFRRPR